jgi:hypothetical protein
VPHVPSPPIAPAPKFTFVEPTSPVHIRDLERHHCRWMPGEPATLMYCGKTKSEGSPYCTKHTRAAYNR